jgi:hypothetical protein
MFNDPLHLQNIGMIDWPFPVTDLQSLDIGIMGQEDPVVLLNS